MKELHQLNGGDAYWFLAMFWLPSNNPNTDKAYKIIQIFVSGQYLNEIKNKIIH